MPEMLVPPSELRRLFPLSSPPPLSSSSSSSGTSEHKRDEDRPHYAPMPLITCEMTFKQLAMACGRCSSRTPTGSEAFAALDAAVGHASDAHSTTVGHASDARGASAGSVGGAERERGERLVAHFGASWGALADDVGFQASLPRACAWSFAQRADLEVYEGREGAAGRARAMLGAAVEMCPLADRLRLQLEKQAASLGGTLPPSTVSGWESLFIVCRVVQSVAVVFVC